MPDYVRFVETLSKDPKNLSIDNPGTVEVGQVMSEDQNVTLLHNLLRKLEKWRSK